MKPTMKVLTETTETEDRKLVKAFDLVTKVKGAFENYERENGSDPKFKFKTYRMYGYIFKTLAGETVQSVYLTIKKRDLWGFLSEACRFLREHPDKPTWSREIDELGPLAEVKFEFRL